MVGEGSLTCQRVVDQRHEPVKMIEFGGACPAGTHQGKYPRHGGWRDQPGEGSPEITGKNRTGGGEGCHIPLENNFFKKVTVLR